MENPLLTIVCLTYNQENYIRETLDSFLMQQTTFEFDILIHDDASTDNTLAIIEEYKSLYPNKIKVIRQRENIYKSKGLLYIYWLAISTCTSKYIAYCEGDDYYASESKLQKQVDFLEKNSDYKLVHTGFFKYKTDKNKISPFKLSKRQLTGNIFNDILRHNMIIAPTVVFDRNIATDALNELVPISISQKWQTADYPIWLYIAKHSKIGYIEDRTTVYRYSKESISSCKNRKKYTVFLLSIKMIKEYFITKYNVSDKISNTAVTQSASEIYRYALKSRDSELIKMSRKLFIKNIDYVNNKKLIFFSKYPFLNKFYF